MTCVDFGVAVPAEVVQSIHCPEGPSSQHLKPLVPKTIQGIWLLEAETINIGYLDPLGYSLTAILGPGWGAQTGENCRLRK